MSERRNFGQLNRPGFGPIILVILTLATLGFGGYFYYGQLASTPFYLWLFVPDCPLYAALASVILLSGWPKGGQGLLGALAAPFRFTIASACALYGSWTIFVFIVYWTAYLAPTQLPITLILIFGHLGMILQAMLVLPKKKEIGAAAGWLLALVLAWLWLGLNTLIDYGFGPLSTHPWLTDPLNPSIAVFTWTGSLIVPLALLMLGRLSGENNELERLRGWLRWNKRAQT